MRATHFEAIGSGLRKWVVLHLEYAPAKADSIENDSDLTMAAITI
jgi:hypothetical protein